MTGGDQALDVRRPSARRTLGREPGRYGLVAVLVVASFARFGLLGGLGVVLAAALAIGGVALHAVRARLIVEPGRLAHRRFVRWREVDLPPGAGLLRVRAPGFQVWGEPEDHAIHVVLDREGKALLRWSGRWAVDSAAISRAAGIPLEDRLDAPIDRRSRAALAFPSRHPWMTGTAAAVAIIVAVGFGTRLYLREQDRARDRDAAQMQATLVRHAEDAARTARTPALQRAWAQAARPGGIELERQGGGPYSADPDTGVLVFVQPGAGAARPVAVAVCEEVVRVLRGAPLALRRAYVDYADDEEVSCGAGVRTST